MHCKTEAIFLLAVSIAGFSDGFTSSTSYAVTPKSSFILSTPSLHSSSLFAVRQQKRTVPGFISELMTVRQRDGELEHSDEVTKARFITRERARVIFERVTDTMKSAGFVDENADRKPLVSLFGGGRKMFLGCFLLLVIRGIRAKFFLKQKFSEKQPAWGHVITSKEQEEVLHAWSCKECGTTMFIAKGREFRFFNRFVECYNCGAKGKDSFYDRREEIVEHDDTNFEYENPMDYLSKAERKKAEKEMAAAGVGDTGAVAVAEKVGTQVEEVVDDALLLDTKEVEISAEESTVDSAEEKVVEETPAVEDAVLVEETVVETPVETKPLDSDSLDILGMDF